MYMLLLILHRMSLRFMLLPGSGFMKLIKWMGLTSAFTVAHTLELIFLTLLAIAQKYWPLERATYDVLLWINASIWERIIVII